MKALNIKELMIASSAVLLIFTGAPLRADDHGDTAATARPIGSGVISGAIQSPTDQDMFVFRPTSGGMATVVLLPSSPGAAQGRFLLELLNASQARIASSYGNNVKYVVQAGARYFIRIRKLANMSATPGGYRLKLSLPEGAVPFPVTSNIVGGSLETSDDVNLFTFSLPAPGLVNVTTRPASPSTAPLRLFCELYDSAGNRRGHVWSGGDIRLVLNQPGRYYVKVTPENAAPNTGSFAVQICTNDRATQVASSYAGSFDVPQDRDYVKFGVIGTRRVRITSSGAPGIRASLYDAAGNRKIVAFSGRNSLIIDQTLTSGSYYLLLEPSTAPVKTGSYRITIAR